MKRYIRANTGVELTADNIMALLTINDFTHTTHTFRDIDDGSLCEGIECHSDIHDTLEPISSKLTQQHRDELDKLVQKYNYSGWAREPQQTVMYINGNIANYYVALSLYEVSSDTFGIIWNNYLKRFNRIGSCEGKKYGDTYYFYDTGDAIIVTLYSKTDECKLAYLDKKTVISLMDKYL